ncbi:MAG: hypothetical protein XD85_0442 [Parcubacteria bacterium 34_609]|nr:MAG: hypothetical protein XD85_0442 [Parcubacteria bacterium 34_609]
MNFPIEKTKMGNDRKFNLSDPKEREEYFKLKCGVESRISEIFRKEL